MTDKRPENLLGDIILEIDNLDSFTVDSSYTAGITKGDLVKLDGDKQITRCTATNGSEHPVGVAYKSAAAGALCPVIKRGKTKVIANGTINAGDMLTSDYTNSVSGVVTTTDATKAFATALQSASSGDYIEISVGLI
jgi:hypothetical protein